MKKHILYVILATATITMGGSAMAFELKSSAFANGGAIPAKYACDGQDISPPLSWSGAPVGTMSFALIVDDPDAPVGTWVHWVVWNIPVITNNLKEGLDKFPNLQDGIKQGLSDFKRTGWGGPCPPSGTHRYIFKLYALDRLLGLDQDTTKEKLEAEMKSYVLDRATLMGTYSRAK